MPCGLRDTVIGVPAELRIEPISPAQMQMLLPMIGAYQRFYEVEEIDEERNRGEGIGRALIEASAEVARRRGAHHLEWATAPGNKTAQRLYDSTGAERSEWIEYELRLGPGA